MRKITREALRVLTRFDERASCDETNVFLTKLAHTHATEITDPAVREYLSDCLTRSDFLGLCNFDPPYEQLTPADSFHARQVCAFFQKRADLELGIDREKVAVESFKRAEALCSETNFIFSSWSRGEFQFPPRVEAALHAAQRKIAMILGEVPLPGEIKFRFGPGATTTRQKRWSHPLYKLADEIACSEDLLPVCGVFLAEMPQWARVHATAECDDKYTTKVLVTPGRVAFVPKSWKTHRSIVVEPSLNTMCQLGIGDYLARRLKLSGIDISDQTRNQNFAKEGSISGRVATLDLSSASDTIAWGLVLHLLPPDWFELLAYTRTGTVDLDGELIQQHKFSSMGNGFTFPLETLIFFALAYASCEGSGVDSVSVYGDDIIVPTHAVSLLRDLLHSCGFILNSEKSYWDGSFRESCGRDYHLGTDVRPFFQRDSLTGQSLFSLHNFYFRRGDKRHRLVLALIGQHFRVFGPDGHGDGHLLHEEWRSFASRRPKEATYDGVLFYTYAAGSRRSFHKTDLENFAYVTYSVYESKPYLPDYGEFPAESRRLYGNRKSNFFLRAAALSFRETPLSKSNYHKSRLGVTLPGVKEYRRISVYTFAR